VISAAKSCTIRKNADTIETASSTSGTARTFVAGRTSWTVELNHLVTYDDNKGGIPQVGNQYSLAIKVGTTTVLSGTAICTEATITATKGSLSQGSIKFQGTGALSES
jgi:predicted secreted protein